MLMVIFGAGASFDSDPARSNKNSRVIKASPPLAERLFDLKAFRHYMNSFPECLKIAPKLQGKQASGVSVEQTLEMFQNQAEEGRADRPKQLAAIRFYLQTMLWDVEEHWVREMKGISNYKTLLSELQGWRDLEKPQDEIYLVTFNYDTLLETALAQLGVELRSLPTGYIDANDTFKLIKLHGSVDWAHEVVNAADHIENYGNLSSGDFSKELIECAADLKFSEEYRRVTKLPLMPRENKAFFPALAIPVQSKKHFECPEMYLKALWEFIPKVTKILVIGWAAAEEHFLKELFDRLQHEVSVHVVSNSAEGANNTLSRLENDSKGINLGKEGFTPGFTQFVAGSALDNFLKP